MPGVLFKIPLTRWIRGTIGKMNRFGKPDFQSWSNYWLETYRELDGLKDECGSKDCPKYAAYGLWRIGRIKDANVPYQEKAINDINHEYGKNAAYAALALDLLEKRQAARDNANLWIQVQEIYRRTIHEELAKSQQGAITVAVTLFEEGQIVTMQE
jgi:hypothetical protein